MPRPPILIVDDEPDICELLSITLERMDLAPRVAGSVGAAQRLLKTERFDLCLTDMRLPDGDGLDLVKWIQQYSASVPVAVITAHGNMETAVRALKLGACAHLRRIRHRQGIGVEAHTRVGSAPGWPVCTGELRRHPHRTHGKRAFRAQAWQFH